MKIKFRITEPFFITPCIAVYHGMQFAWLCFEVDIISASAIRKADGNE